MGLRETARKYDVNHAVILKWKRVYLEEGAKGLIKERRGRACSSGATRKGRPLKLDKKVEEDLIAEYQRLLENITLFKVSLEKRIVWIMVIWKTFSVD